MTRVDQQAIIQRQYFLEQALMHIAGKPARGFYTDQDDAIERARMRRDLLDAATAESSEDTDSTTPIDPYLQVIEVVSSVEDPS